MEKECRRTKFFSILKELLRARDRSGNPFCIAKRLQRIARPGAQKTGSFTERESGFRNLPGFFASPMKKGFAFFHILVEFAASN